jgi:hypothetical protein
MFDFHSNGSGVFQDLENTDKKGVYKIFTCAPAFKITETKGVFYLNVAYMFQEPNFDDTFEIVSVSNKRLILANHTGRVIYNKQDE